MEAVIDYTRKDALAEFGKDDVMFLRGYIATADVLNGTLSVVLEDGSRIAGVKMLFDSADGTGANLNTPDSRNAPCLVMVVGKGTRREAFCLGVYARESDDESSPLKTDEFVPGDQGWFNVNKNAFIALRRNGVIDLKSGEICRVRLNPKTNKVQVFGMNLEFAQGPDNLLTWSMIEDPITGAPSKSILELKVKPDLSKDDTIGLSIGPGGVSLESSLDVSVETGGSASISAEGDANVISQGKAKIQAPKIIAEGELAVGAEGGTKHLALAEDVKSALSAIASAYENLLTALSVINNPGTLAGQPAAIQTLQTAFTTAKANLQNFNALVSTKHTIDG